MTGKGNSVAMTKLLCLLDAQVVGALTGGVEVSHPSSGSRNDSHSLVL